MQDTVIKPVFRIFVSSTFADFRAERAALHVNVFPSLRQMCEAAGFQFQAVDLRWGVSEEATLDHKTIDICLKEIKRCQQLSPRPNFLILLGDRYGWQPVPARIAADEFDSLLKELNDADQECLQYWFVLDQNAIPPQRVLRRATTQEAFPEERLQTLLRNAAKSAQLPSARLDAYQLSATGHEILAGALNERYAPDAEHHVNVFVRAIRGLPEDKTSACYSDFANNLLDDDARQNRQDLAVRLLERLGEDNHWRYDEDWLGITDPAIDNPEITHRNLEAFCQQVEQRLRAIIQAEIDRCVVRPSSEIEMQEQCQFADDRRRNFAGREGALERINAFLTDQDESQKRCLLIHGPSGCGKSALLAEAMHRHGRATDLTFYIGSTAQSGSASVLLEHIYRQLGGQGDLPQAAEKIREVLTGQLQSFKRTLALDAIDQLPATEANWLFERLPKEPPLGSRILITCADDRMAPLEQQIPPHQKLTLNGLPDEIGKHLLITWLSEDEDNRRTVTAPQRMLILKGYVASGGLPLYLRIATRIAKEWESWQTVEPLPETLSGLIGALYDNLHQERGHGPVLCARALAMLAASRDGLAEAELIELLGRDRAVIEEFRKNHPESPPIDELPPILWSRLQHDLNPFLSERMAQGTRVLVFFHRQFHDAAAERWLKGAAGWEIHAHMAAYFESKVLFLDGAQRKQPNARKITQLPWHLERTETSAKLHALLQDFDFSMATCQAEQVDNLVRCHEHLSSATDELKTWRDFIISNAHILRRGNESWPAHKIFLQLAVEHAEDSPVKHAAEKWLGEGNCDWVWLRNPQLVQHAPPDLSMRVFEGHANEVIGALELPDGRILSWSWDHTLRLWDRKNCKSLACLVGHTSFIKDVQILGNGRIRSRSDDGIMYLWDGETGRPLQVTSGIEGALVLHDGRLLSWSYDGNLRIWDEDTSEPFACLEELATPVIGMKELSDGRIISWSGNNTLCILDGMTGCPLATYETTIYVSTGRKPWENTFCPCTQKKLVSENANLSRYRGELVIDPLVLDGGRILITSDVLELKVLDGNDCIHVTPSNQGSRVTAAVLLADGRILSGTDCGDLFLWDGETGEPQACLHGHTEAVYGLLELRNGRIASWAGDDTLRIWDSRIKTQLFCLEGRRFCLEERYNINSIREVIELTDGRILSWLSDGSLFLWNQQTGELLARLDGHTDIVIGALEVGDGSILSWSFDGTLRRWEGDSCEILKRFSGDEISRIGENYGSITSLGDGRVLFQTSRTLCLLNGQTGKLIACHTHDVPYFGMRVISTGEIIFCSGPLSHDNSFILWRAEASKQVGANIRHHQRGVVGTEVLTCGRILSWSQDRTLRLWELQTGKMLACLEGHDDVVFGATELADGRILSWSEDGSLRLWENRTGELLITLKPRAPLFELVETDKGTVPHEVGLSDEFSEVAVEGAIKLASGHVLSWAGCMLYLWDVQCGLEIARLNGHSQQVLGAIQLSDGRIHSWALDGTECYWDGQTGAALGKFTTKNPFALLIRSRKTVQEIRSGQAKAESENNSVAITSSLDDNFFVSWQANAVVAARHLFADGILVITLSNGDVSCLQLYRGAQRIGLQEGAHSDGWPKYVGEPDQANKRSVITQPFHHGQRIGRNDPCPCGSGDKYKHCHGKLS